MGDETRQVFERWSDRKIELHLLKRCPLYFHERELWWVSLGQNIGSEQGGKGHDFARPVLVLLRFNKRMFFGLPMTSTQKNDRFHTRLELHKKDVFVILSQGRLLSSNRLRRKIKSVSEADFSRVRGEFINMFTNNDPHETNSGGSRRPKPIVK